jgi:hypothetical protein
MSGGYWPWPSLLFILYIFTPKAGTFPLARDSNYDVGSLLLKESILPTELPERGF